MKTVAITGANNGLGYALTQLYLNKGWQVLGLDIQTNKLEELNSSNIDFFQADITSTEALKLVAEKFENVDLLICNAGIIDFFPLIEDIEERLRKIFEVNFHGAVNTLRAFKDHLINAHGKVLFISSESVVIPGCFQPYQITKIALEGYVNSVRPELRMKGVQAAIIRPSAIQTNVLDKISDMRNHSNSSFEDSFQSFQENAVKRVGKVMMANEVAEKIVKISEKDRLKAVYRIKNKMMYRIFSLFPSKTKDKMMIKVLNKNNKSFE